MKLFYGRFISVVTIKSMYLFSTKQRTWHTQKKWFFFRGHIDCIIVIKFSEPHFTVSFFLWVFFLFVSLFLPANLCLFNACITIISVENFIHTCIYMWNAASNICKYSIMLITNDEPNRKCSNVKRIWIKHSTGNKNNKNKTEKQIRLLFLSNMTTSQLFDEKLTHMALRHKFNIIFFVSHSLYGLFLLDLFEICVWIA